MLSLVATDHAIQRSRERLRWSRATLDRMLERVVYAGIAAEDCTGPLAWFLQQLSGDAHHHCTRVYGGHIFVFAIGADRCCWSLLTVYPLPCAHRAAAHRAQRQQLAFAA